MMQFQVKHSNWLVLLTRTYFYTFKDKENKRAKGGKCFKALWNISGRLKSCFLVDLRSFLLLSFVDWEQRRLYCNKEAAATSTCCAVSYQLSQLWFVSNQHNFARSLETLFRIHATSLKCSRSCVAGLYTWLHCSEFPERAGNFAKLRETSSQSCCAGEQLFPKHFIFLSNEDGLSFFFFLPKKAPFICKLFGGSCFVWRVTTSLRNNNRKRRIRSNPNSISPVLKLTDK